MAHDELGLLQEQAWRRLLLDLREAIRRQARHLQPSWQEDCLQEVALRILERARCGDPVRNPVGFAVTFVRRRIVDEFRRRQKDAGLQEVVWVKDLGFRLGNYLGLHATP